jgi:hypothetical protein
MGTSPRGLMGPLPPPRDDGPRRPPRPPKPLPRRDGSGAARRGVILLKKSIKETTDG